MSSTSLALAALEYTMKSLFTEWTPDVHTMLLIVVLLVIASIAAKAMRRASQKHLTSPLERVADNGVQWMDAAARFTDTRSRNSTRERLADALAEKGDAGDLLQAMRALDQAAAPTGRNTGNVLPSPTALVIEGADVAAQDARDESSIDRSGTV